MLDYYQILGISKEATFPEIKSAYKQLALKYHPDKNDGSTHAEEKFKEINEAYQILSDPYKKASYDLLVSYSQVNYQPETSYTPPTSHRKRQSEKSVYDRYAKYDWRNAPRYKTAPSYKIDKRYIRNQGITLLTVGILAAVIIGIVQFNTYREEQKELRIQQANQKVINEAQQLFDQGQHREAVTKIVELVNKNPVRHSIYEVRESMVSSLFTTAEMEFNQNHYSSAVSKLEVVRDFERPMHLETWEMLAECYENLKEYRKAAHAYDYVLIRDEHNIDLMMKLGGIYLNHLNMKDKALDYYTEARYKFKEFQESSYGAAFELIVPLETFSDDYYQMFYVRGKLNYDLKDYEEAIHDFNWAISIRPKIAETYHLRALCRIAQNNPARACFDLADAAKLGYKPSIDLKRSVCN